MNKKKKVDHFIQLQATISFLAGKKENNKQLLIENENLKILH